MPTMSSSFVQPLVTPCTALKTSARVRPWTAACESLSRIDMQRAVLGLERDAVGESAPTPCPWGLRPGPCCPRPCTSRPRAAESVSFQYATSSNPYVACESRGFSVVPLQPGRIFPPYYLTQSTPSAWPLLSAPARMAPKARTADTRSRHQTSQSISPPTPSRRAWRPVITPLRRGHDDDAKSALHALDLVAADVDAAAGTRNARQVADGSFVVRAVLQVHAQNQLAFLFLASCSSRCSPLP